MANQARLESSLRRVERLGLEVLERASRRSVVWTNTDPQLPTTTNDHEGGPNPLDGSTHLDDAFETIGAFMAQTTHQCMKFHRSDHGSEYSAAERTHMSRFHSQRAPGSTSSKPTWKQGCTVPSEDFHVEVSPGSYSVTAGMPHTHQQTQRVNLHAGDSITLNFDLRPLS